MGGTGDERKGREGLLGRLKRDSAAGWRLQAGTGRRWPWANQVPAGPSWRHARAQLQGACPTNWAHLLVLGVQEGVGSLGHRILDVAHPAVAKGRHQRAPGAAARCGQARLPRG